MSDEPTIKRLRIVTCTELARWDKKDGSGQGVIYEVSARDEQGNAITVPLRSFMPLEVSEAVKEWAVSKYTDKKGNVSYTLNPPRRGGPPSGARLGPKVDELRAQVNALMKIAEEQGRQLEAVQGWLRSKFGSESEGNAGPPPAPPPPAPAGNPAPEQDIPF